MNREGVTIKDRDWPVESTGKLWTNDVTVLSVHLIELENVGFSASKSNSTKILTLTLTTLIYYITKCANRTAI